MTLAEQIAKTAANIFSHMRDKTGKSIEDKHLYNLHTIRMRRQGEDTSKRRLFMSYLGTTIRPTKKVSCWLTPSLDCKSSNCVCVCN